MTKSKNKTWNFIDSQINPEHPDNMKPTNKTQIHNNLQNTIRILRQTRDLIKTTTYLEDIDKDLAEDYVAMAIRNLNTSLEKLIIPIDREQEKRDKEMLEEAREFMDGEWK